MKKQQHRSILEFMQKIPRTESSEQDTCTSENVSQINFMNDTNGTAASASATVRASYEEEASITVDLPDCWSLRQYEEFKKKYDGLIVNDKKLGCEHCAKVHSINIKGIHISVEWSSCNVKASGTDRTIQQASLRKK